ncbi:uncharacterized protein LOC116259780 [Nymphaea colorata]|nr:uncharacterized protein LOC116259780 [Nymphaea colorata]
MARGKSFILKWKKKKKKKKTGTYRPSGSGYHLSGNDEAVCCVLGDFCNDMGSAVGKNGNTTLRKDVNITNAEKNTPLHWACLNGHSEVVRNLILAGADVAALNSHERTPLDEAVNMGKMDIVDVISSASALAELVGVNIS